MGFLPLEVSWDLMCLKVCRRIRRNNTNVAVREIERGRLVLGRRADRLVKGGESPGMVAKSGECDWGVNVHATPMMKFRRAALARSRAHFIRIAVPRILLEVRTEFGVVPGYLQMRREVAGAVARFRIGYGPDRVLSKLSVAGVNTQL